MLTGDNRTVAKAFALQVGVEDFVADVLPDDKAEAVRALQCEGCTVAMVGDGLNDSPALVHADVGIALGHASDVARETADVLLMHSDLRQLIDAIELSRDTLKLVRQNFSLVVGLNALAFALAIPRGWVSPATIATISNGSTIVATLNAARPVLLS